MFDVKLHVYDLSNGMAAQFSRQLVGKHIEGVWHTGIVVYNKEYYFGGGISYDSPGRTPFGRPTKTIDLGFTELPEELFLEFLREVSPRFTQATYNVFKHNCNNFTNECANFLMGQGIPKDIIDLPNEFLNTPLGRMIGPMLEQAQDNLKVQSHQLFDNTGHQNPLVTGGPSTFAQQPSTGANPGAQMNDFVNMFAQSMGGGSQPAPQQTASYSAGAATGKANEVIQIQSLHQLNALIKESPALAIDFWSPQCPPCMRIKPTFENLAKSNDNENLKFAAVNTMQQRECCAAFKITSIPQFYFYVNGKQVSQFKGADESKLFSSVAEIAEQVKTGVVKHKTLSFQQFKPMNLAPQGFTSMGAIDKMKEFVMTFAKSDEALKEVKSTQNLQKWLSTFKLDSIPREAIDELMDLVEVAEDKNKIALIDLLRLLIVHEGNAAHILNKHWHRFEVSIFGYLQCMDIKDPEAKIMQNYHLICLKMLGNIYQTDTGRDFLQGEEASSALMNFCIFSFDSINSKVVFTAAVVLFNHILTFRRDKAIIKDFSNQALEKISSVIQEGLVQDNEALMGLLMCECRIIYGNKHAYEYIFSKLEPAYRKNHQALKVRATQASVKEGVNDVLLMLFDE